MANTVSGFPCPECKQRESADIVDWIEYPRVAELSCPDCAHVWLVEV